MKFKGAPERCSPALYRLSLFQSTPGWGEEASAVPGESTAPSFLEPLVKKPLVAARLLCYALAFGAFLGYALLTFAHDNSCSRLHGFSATLPAAPAAPEGGIDSSSDTRSYGFIINSLSAIATKVYHCVDVFHWDPEVAHSSLGLPPLPLHAGLSSSFSSLCSSRSTMLAEVRLARGKTFLFASLLLIMLSLLVIRPATQIHSSLKARAVISQLSRASILQAVKQGGGEEKKNN